MSLPNLKDELDKQFFNSSWNPAYLELVQKVIRNVLLLRREAAQKEYDKLKAQRRWGCHLREEDLLRGRLDELNEQLGEKQ